MDILLNNKTYKRVNFNYNIFKNLYKAPSIYKESLV